MASDNARIKGGGVLPTANPKRVKVKRGTSAFPPIGICPRTFDYNVSRVLKILMHTRVKLTGHLNALFRPPPGIHRSSAISRSAHYKTQNSAASIYKTKKNAFTLRVKLLVDRHFSLRPQPNDARAHVRSGSRIRPLFKARYVRSCRLQGRFKSQPWRYMDLQLGAYA